MDIEPAGESNFLAINNDRQIDENEQAYEKPKVQSNLQEEG